MRSPEVERPVASRAEPGRAPDVPTVEPVVALFDPLVRLAVDALPAVSAVSVTLPEGRNAGLRAVNAGHAAVLAVDRYQHETASGPCVTALRTGAEVRTPIPARQWPEFSSGAGAAAVRAVWSLPMPAGERVAGSFNVYSTVDSPWDGSSAGVVALLAAHAAAALAATVAQAESEHMAATLRQALETRTVIGQAQGILMARQDVTPDGAFDILRRASQRTNRKLREVAADIVQGVTEHAAAHPHPTAPDADGFVAPAPRGSLESSDR